MSQKQKLWDLVPEEQRLRWLKFVEVNKFLKIMNTEIPEMEGVAVKDCVTAKMCPSCEYVLCDVVDPGIPYHVASAWGYCPNCGTKIDWSGEE